MANQITSYMQAKVETASPAQLILILYDELIKTLLQATDCLRKRQHESSHQKLIKAQRIVGELAGSINLEAGAVAQNLLSLYQYMIEELVNANTYKDEKRLGAIVTIATDLRNVWVEGVILATQTK